MAAIDYTVCLHSEVFVTTQGGNFPHFLMGHRRYMYGGHSKTIRPDKRKLAILFDNPNIGYSLLLLYIFFKPYQKLHLDCSLFIQHTSVGNKFFLSILCLHSSANLKPCRCVFCFFFPRRWRSFKRQMLNMRSHSDSKGFELKRPNDSIYTFPCPDCMSRMNKTTTPDSRPPPATWKRHTFYHRPTRIRC